MFIPKNQSEDIFKYPEYECCDNPIIVLNQGYNVCSNCGEVHNKNIVGSPVRAFTAQEVEDRKVTEPVYSIIGPRTVIRGKTDARGSMLHCQDQRKFHRLGKIHRSLTSSYERNLWIALPKIKKIQEKLSLPDSLMKDARNIYIRAVKKKLTMGRSIDILLAASIFVALKIHKIPRVVEELEEVFATPKKSIVRAYRLLVLEILPNMNLKVKHLSPFQYIDKFCTQLDLPMKIHSDSSKLLKYTQAKGFLVEGKDPKGLAAAAIYLMCKYQKIQRTQRVIAKTAHITEVTLRVRSKDILKYFKK